jgi:hypothetical protein
MNKNSLPMYLALKTPEQVSTHITLIYENTRSIANHNEC